MIYEKTFDPIDDKALEEFLADMKDLLEIKEEKLQLLKDSVQGLEVGHGIQAEAILGDGTEQHVIVDVVYTYPTSNPPLHFRVKVDYMF